MIIPISDGENRSELIGWKIGLFEIGNLCDCIYSCCCPVCALYESNYKINGSPFCFNVLLSSMHKVYIDQKQLYRSNGVNFNDDECCSDDCCVACFFCPCSINRIYQTTKMKEAYIYHNQPLHCGNIGGKGNWELGLFECGSPLVACFSCCCPMIAIAYARYSMSIMYTIYLNV